MDIQKLSKAITKAIAYTENGGAPNIHSPSQGKTGEMKSIFQFTPDTWKNYSQQIFGRTDVPLNADTETYVANQKISGWAEKLVQLGKSPTEIAEQIASMWNAGTGEPEAYTGKFSNGSSSVGVNKKYDVAYDVPGYAKKVANYTNEFLNGGDTQQGQQGPQVQQENAQSTPTTAGTQSTQTSGGELQGNSAYQNLLTIINQAKSNNQTQATGNKGLVNPKKLTSPTSQSSYQGV